MIYIYIYSCGWITVMIMERRAVRDQRDTFGLLDSMQVVFKVIVLYCVSLYVIF